MRNPDVRGVFIFLFLLSYVFLTACNSSVKTLNESSAKRLLNEHLKTKGNTYLISTYAVAQHIRPTTEDYLAGSYKASDPKMQMQRLLRAGFITQSREDVKYGNVTGTYRAEIPGCGSGGIGIRNRIYTFTLFMEPGRSTISGRYTFDAWRNSGQKAATFSGPVKGSITPEGNVTLIYGPMLTHVDYKFKSDAQNIVLTGPSGFECEQTEIMLAGTGPGGYITEPKFSYAYGEKIKPLLDDSENLKAGTMKIDEVHKLLLETETVATAKYTWHVELNEVGFALTGMQRISEQGTAVFRKQPDGSWVLPED